ncbi:MAG: thermonuclease family protein [Deltaproteobacteria bacterium]|nr:thermonuclease family protein [Deltaproteobacteria bacterium]
MYARLVPLVATACWYTPPDLEIVRDVPVEPGEVGGIAFVACVLDGDTVDLYRCNDDVAGETVRLLGIDAPEIEHPPEPADCWGPEAAAVTSRLLLGREVLVTFDGGPAEDLYGRTLAYLWAIDDTLEDLSDEPGINEVVELDSDLAEDGRALLINEYLAAQGHAQVYGPEVFGELKLQARLEAAQAAAQLAGRGMWGPACGSPEEEGE